jgi:hypothetical protein
MSNQNEKCPFALQFKIAPFCLKKIMVVIGLVGMWARSLLGCGTPSLVLPIFCANIAQGAGWSGGLVHISTSLARKKCNTYRRFRLTMEKSGALIITINQAYN